MGVLVRGGGSTSEVQSLNESLYAAWYGADMEAVEVLCGGVFGGKGLHGFQLEEDAAAESCKIVGVLVVDQH